MRVITGIARGRNLEALAGDDVRPTPDRVKEAIFSIIQFEIEGRNVLDLFAGSGQMGIEALSRGAAKAVFVDVNKKSIDIIQKNLTLVKLSQNAKVAGMDFSSFLMTNTIPFDIAFLDPPYNYHLIEQALPLLVPQMNKGGVIVCEHESKTVLPPVFGEYKIQKVYRYGHVSVTVYREDVQA